MAKIANFILFTFVVLLFNGAKQPEVEGAWVTGVMTGFKVVNEIVTLLDKLNLIPNDDLSKADEILKCIDELNDKIDRLSDEVISISHIFSLNDYNFLNIDSSK